MVRNWDVAITVGTILAISLFVFVFATLGEIRNYNSFSKSDCVLDSVDYHNYTVVQFSSCRYVTECTAQTHCAQVSGRQGTCCNGAQLCDYSLRTLLWGSARYTDEFGRRFTLEFEGKDATFRYGNATCWTNDDQLMFKAPAAFFPSFIWYMLAICFLFAICGAVAIEYCNQRFATKQPR